MKSKVVLAVCGILLVLSVLNFASAITGKIGNARAVLYPEVGFWGTSIDRTIYIENVNNESVNVTLDAGNSTILKLVEKNFILQPGESRNAAFKIKLKKPGEYTEKLNIFFTPLGKNSAGVALTSTYIIHAKKAGSDSGSGGDNSDNSNINNSDSAVSGNAIKMQNFVADNKAVIAVSASTLILAALLVVLVYFGKKRNKEGKLKTKRSEKNI
jgi:hypothetical protein